jgi:hypothetical protein
MAARKFLKIGTGKQRVDTTNNHVAGAKGLDGIMVRYRGTYTPDPST